MHCAKFGWNWLSGSGEDFLILSRYLRYFVIISPWKRTGHLIWINFKPLYQRLHCAKFGWNWPSGSGEDFLISSMYFCYFVIIYPWKRAGPFIRRNLNPLHPRMHCAKFEIGPVFLEKKSKIGKVYRRTDRQTTTDDIRSEKRTRNVKMFIIIGWLFWSLAPFTVIIAYEF